MSQTNIFSDKNLGYESKLSFNDNKNDYFRIKLNRQRKSFHLIKNNSNKTTQNFLEQNSELLTKKQYKSLGSRQKYTPIFHTRPMNPIDDVKDKIDLKIIDNYHKIFLNEKNNKYSTHYLNNIYKLLYRKDHNYSEKRFLVSTYENFMKEQERIYITGVQPSNKNEKNIKSSSKHPQITNENKPLIKNEIFYDEMKKNLIDFNTKYLTQEANALREKLKSRQSRADGQNFPKIQNNNLNSNKDTEKIEYRDKENIGNETENENKIKKRKKCENSSMDGSIKVGLEVEFNESGSTPNLTEIVDSENELKLDETQKKKLILKNLSKKYHFQTDEEIKNNINEVIKITKSTKLFENKVKDLKIEKIENSDNNSNLEMLEKFNKNKKNYNKPKELKIKTKQTLNSLIFGKNINQKKNIMEKTKNFSQTINYREEFMKNNPKENFQTLKTNRNNKDEVNEAMDVDSPGNSDVTISSNDSLMKYVTKVYKLRQKNSFDSPNMKEYNSKKTMEELKCSEKYPDFKSLIEKQNLNRDIIGKKGSLLNEFKNTNFYNKFKIFENNNNFHKTSNETTKITRGNKTMTDFKNGISSRNNNNNIIKIVSEEKINLNPKELKKKKLDEMFVKSINYDDIVKQNINMLKGLFPAKNSKGDNTLKIGNSNKEFNKFYNFIKDTSRNKIIMDSNNNTDFYQTINESITNNIENNQIYLNTENESFDKSNLLIKEKNKIEKDNNKTIHNNDEINKKKLKFSPIKDNQKKNNFRMHSIDEFNENDSKINESMTFAQSLNKIVKGNNNIFNKNGGINKNFLKDLRKINSENSGLFIHKCYNTKSIEKFDKLLTEKINDLNK